MSSERPDEDARADAIFDRALDLPSTDRIPYLDDACGNDTALRARLERLLAYADTPPSMLDRALTIDWWPVEDAPPATEWTVPDRVGPYRLSEAIGHGGMGVVYRGMRDDGFFDQEVAVKIMRQGMDNPEARRRFEQERQIIASLQHPNIARLYDGGITPDGRPYSAMELVDGQPITTYCDEHGLGVAARLRLMETVGRAVHYAHQNLVVHCDLKPSNILVTPDGEVKLLDFGIAQLLDLAPATALTPPGPPRSGAEHRASSGSDSRGLTPLYASPEQLRGEPMTTASDVYQLGLLLFELLTGTRARSRVRLPSQRPRRRTSSPRATRNGAMTPSAATTKDGPPPIEASDGADALRVPPPVDIPKPSVAAAGRGDRARARALRGDLDAIAGLALASHRTARYPSAAGLVTDLERHRRREPVAARRSTWRYRAGRFVLRHRVGVAIGVVLATMLVGYAVTVTAQAQRIARERDRAQHLQAFALEVFSASDPTVTLRPDLSAAELVAHGVTRAEEALATEPELLADVKAHLGRIYRRLGRHEAAESLLRDVLALRLAHNEAPHLAIAAAQSELGRLLLERDDAEALQLLESALAQQRTLLGPDHAETARTLVHLGYYLRSAGRRHEAESRLREALDIQRRTQPGSQDEVGTLRGLAWTVRFLGRPEEAEPMLRRALEILPTLYEDGHPEIASAWNDMATVLYQLERWPEGDEAIRRAIDAKKALYGENHHSIATSLANHAGSLRRRGDLEAAEAVYRQTLAMRRAVFGPSHPRLAQSIAQMAELLHQRGQPERAAPLFDQALEMFREHLPPRHPSLGRVWRGLGALRLDTDDLDAARQALDHARDAYRTVDGSPWLGRIDVMLAEIDHRQGRTDDAESRLVKAKGELGDDAEWQARWQRAMARLDDR